MPSLASQLPHLTARFVFDLASNTQACLQAAKGSEPQYRVNLRLYLREIEPAPYQANTPSLIPAQTPRIAGVSSEIHRWPNHRQGTQGQQCRLREMHTLAMVPGP